jgi:hypothetical protein
MGNSSSQNTQLATSDDKEDKFLGQLAKDNKLAESMTDKDSRSVAATVKDLEGKSGK